MHYNGNLDLLFKFTLESFMTLTEYFHSFCTQTERHAHTHTHALLPLPQRLTLIPEYTLTQTGVPCQELRVFSLVPLVLN